MATTFPRARKGRPGYDVDQVEDFLEDARRAFGTQPGEPVVVTAESIRHTAFSLQRGGYSTTHVDAALERLEDAFAQRERERALAEQGEEAWYSEARQTAQAVLDRLARPEGKRFVRVGPLTTGYHPADVDRFATRLVEYFQRGTPVTIEEVRTVSFRGRKRGYSEAQVDLVLDAVVRVMLAVR